MSNLTERQPLAPASCRPLPNVQLLLSMQPRICGTAQALFRKGNRLPAFRYNVYC